MFQNRNLIAVLNNNRSGIKLASKLSNKENLSVAELNEFNRIIVDDLVAVCG